MFNVLKAFSILLVVLLLAGCYPDVVKQTNESKNSENTTKLSNKTEPNDCLIIGTIISISDSLEKSDPNSPCAKVPCTALVNIDSLLNGGNSSLNVREGKAYYIHFTSTLAPMNKSMLPNVENDLPGLALAQNFEVRFISKITPEKLLQK